MTEYLKMVPLPSWWQKLDLNEFPISELFEDPLSWNPESKLITPKYITGTHSSAIVAIFNFCFLVRFPCANVRKKYLHTENNPKNKNWAGPQKSTHATCFIVLLSWLEVCRIWYYFITLSSDNLFYKNELVSKWPNKYQVSVQVLYKVTLNACQAHWRY